MFYEIHKFKILHWNLIILKKFLFLCLPVLQHWTTCMFGIRQHCFNFFTVDFFVFSTVFFCLSGICSITVYLYIDFNLLHMYEFFCCIIICMFALCTCSMLHSSNLFSYFLYFWSVCSSVFFKWLFFLNNFILV